MIDYKEIQTLYPRVYGCMMLFFYGGNDCFPALETHVYQTKFKDRELYDFFDACGVYISTSHANLGFASTIDVPTYPYNALAKLYSTRNECETEIFKCAFETLNRIMTTEHFVPYFLDKKIKAPLTIKNQIT